MLKALLRRYRRPLSALAVVSAAAGLSDALALVALVPLATAIASGDDAFAGSFAGVEVSLGVGSLLAVTLALMLVRFAFSTTESWLISRLVARYEHEEREEVFAAFVDADWALQSESRGGHLQDILTTYVHRSILAFDHLCTSLTSTVNLVALLAITVVLHPLMAVLAGAVSVVVFLIVRPVSSVAARVSHDQRRLTLRLAGAVHEAVLMARETRVFAVGRALKERMAVLLAENARQRQRQRFLADMSSTIYQSLALVLVVGGLAVVWATDIDVSGSLAAVVVLLIRALTYAQGVQRPYHRFREAEPLFVAVEEEKERLHRAHERTGGREPSGLDTLEFVGAGLTYDDGTVGLRDLSVVLRRGTTVGIVGPSGAGKSSFLQLLMQLRPPTEGRLLVDGVPAEEVSLDALRRRVGYVPQEPLLLNAPVEDNIRYLRPDISREAVEQAARMAHVHDEITAFTHGYATEVGERGSSISGGQRQRICLARALVGRPDILVLDEPTSALDGRSEALVQKTIEEIKGSMLVVIVAHRLSTLSDCDLVMVLEGGRLTAFGPPAEVQASSRYFHAARQQAELS